MGIGPTVLGSGDPLAPESASDVADFTRLVSYCSRAPRISLIWFSCSGLPTWKHLISRPPTTRECIPLITAIFSDKNEIGVVQSLCGDDAQAFIDVIDEVSVLFHLRRTGPLIQTETFHPVE